MTNGQQPPWVGQPTNPNVPVQPQPGQQMVQQPVPQQPVQQPGYPVPPAPAPQPVQPGQAPHPSTFVQPGAMVPAQPQPQPGVMPQYHIPDDAAVLAAYQQHRQEAATWGTGGDRIPFVKWPGPQGQTKWDKTVPIGFEASIYAYILPPWAQGKNIFRMVKSHFWKSYNFPNGTSIGCPGSAHCLICQAKEAALKQPDLNLQKRAKDFGRVRTQYLYNVVLLENPNGHFGQDGVMRPFVLGAGAFLHKAIGDIVEDKKGALNVVDPMRGRPIRMKRSKNGPQDMDIQYAAIAQDPASMPSQFYPCLQNIWDLDKLDKQPNMDDMVKAVQDMGLPLPPGMPAVQPQVPAQGFAPPTQGFQPAPPPAQPNPYPAPQMQVGAPQNPTYMPPPDDPFEFPPKDPVVQTTQMYPAQAPAQVPTQPMPAPVPPPVQTQQPWVQPAPAQQPTQVGPPAQMPVPPPVTSQPGQQPVAQQPVYTPQPTQAVPAPPPPGAVAPQQPPAAPQGQIPPAPPVTAPPQVVQQPTRQPVAVAPQPTARPPCFGRPNNQDRTCLECPDQLKAECYATTGQQVQAAPVQPQGLTQLQHQLVGTGQ